MRPALRGPALVALLWGVAACGGDGQATGEISVLGDRFCVITSHDDRGQPDGTNCFTPAPGLQVAAAPGTETYRASQDIRVVQELLGHESPQTRAGYAAYSRLRQLALVLRAQVLDRLAGELVRLDG